MSGLSVDVLGRAVAITAPASLQAELRAALADLPAADGGDRELALRPTDGGFDLHDDGRLVRHGVDPRVAGATVIWRLNAIAGESTDHVLLHAACVAAPSGGAVLLPGGPGAGKSTLTAACVRAGLSYLSDELAAVDRRTGTIAPYAKPLGLAAERLVVASSLGSVADGPAVPAALVFPRYEPGADLSEVPLDPGWALLALAAHATNLGVLGGAALAWLAGLALTCPPSQLTHGDATQAVAAIERAAAASGRPVAPADLLDPVTDGTTTVAVGDSLAVLHEPSGKVHVLNAPAAAVWRRAAAAGGCDGQTPDTGLPIETVLQAADEEGVDRSTASATIDRLVRAGLLGGATVPAGT
jgi:hypothetical protein